MTRTASHLLRSMSVANALPSTNSSTSNNGMGYLRSKSKTIVPLTLPPPAAFASVTTSNTLPPKKGCKISSPFQTSNTCTHPL